MGQPWGRREEDAMMGIQPDASRRQNLGSLKTPLTRPG